MKLDTYQTVDEYIGQFPPRTQEILQHIRKIIRDELPEATEKMSYGIPTYWQGHNIIHFGGFESHVGLYPGPSAIEAFADELTPYKTAKGTVRFPLDQPIPYELVSMITRFNAANLK